MAQWGDYELVDEGQPKKRRPQGADLGGRFEVVDAAPDFVALGRQMGPRPPAGQVSPNIGTGLASLADPAHGTPPAGQPPVATVDHPDQVGGSFLQRVIGSLAGPLLGYDTTNAIGTTVADMGRTAYESAGSTIDSFNQWDEDRQRREAELYGVGDSNLDNASLALDAQLTGAQVRHLAGASQESAANRARHDAAADAIQQQYPDGSIGYHAVGIARSAPPMVAAMISHDPILGAGIIAGTTATQQRSQALADGATENQADASGLVQGILEGGTDAITLGLAKYGFGPVRKMLASRYGDNAALQLLEKLTGNSLGRLGLAIGEGAATEVPTTAAQMASDELILDKHYTPEDYLRGARDSAVQGGLMSGGAYTLGAPFRHLAEQDAAGNAPTQDATTTQPRPAPAPGVSPAQPGAPSELGAMLGQILGGASDRSGPGGPPPGAVPELDPGKAPRAEDLEVIAPPPAAPASGPRQAAPAPTAATTPNRIEPKGREVEPRTPAGTPVKARYAVVDANALTASNDPGGAVNPNYPAALQPRERDRRASQEQIHKIATKLDPTLLGDAPTTADGAPLVAPDGVVESGNGRTLALRQAYQAGGAEHYRAWLKQNAQTFGLDPAEIDGHDSPMLVRVRTGQATPEQRIAIARESNQATVARMGASERAKADAAALTDDTLALFKPNEDGSVLGKGNDEFLNRFAAALPESERGDLLTADGRYSAEMARRVQAAVFARAYQDADLVNLQAEEASPDVRNVLAGLNRAAPAFAKLGNDGGELRAAVVDAVQRIREAKRNGQAIDEALRQDDLLGERAPAAERIASFIAKNVRSASRIGDFLEELAGAADANADRGTVGGGLFGAPDKATTLDGILDQAQRRVAEPGHDEYGTPDDLDAQLRDHGEPIADMVDAERKWDAGQAIYGFHEQDEAPKRIHFYRDLKNWTPDQLLALPRGMEPAGNPRMPAKRQHPVPAPRQVMTPDQAAQDPRLAGTKVVGKDGKPLLVYRGTHGGIDPLATRHGAISFAGDRATADLYANDPNDGTKDTHAKQPHVLEAYLDIRNPVPVDFDPFITFGSLAKLTGNPDLVRAFAIRQAEEVEPHDQFDEAVAAAGLPAHKTSLAQLLEAAPNAIDRLDVQAHLAFDDKAIVDALRAAGYDGAIHEGFGENTGETEYKVFDPAQVVVADAKVRDQLGLFGGPSQAERIDGARRDKTAKRDGLGRDEVPPSRGAGDLFAGKRPDQAEIPAPDTFDAEAGKPRTRHAQVDTLRVSKEPVRNAADALAAFAPLRRNAQEVLAALVLDKHDQPIALLRLTRGGVGSTDVDAISLYGAIANTKGAAKVWLAHNHPSGNPEASNADRVATARISNGLKNTGVRFAGQVVVGRPTEGTEIDGEGYPYSRTARPIARAGKSGRGIPVLERRLTGNRPGPDQVRITSPDVAVAKMDQANPERRLGVLLLDTKADVLGFLPIAQSEAVKLRTGDTATGFQRLARAVGQQNASAAILADPRGVAAISEGAHNLAKALQAMDVRVLDTVHLDGNAWKSNTDRNRQAGDGTGAFQSRMEDVGAALPAQVRTELERAFGKDAIGKLEESGLLVVTRGTDGKVQAEWDGTRITAFEGTIPQGAAAGVLLHEAAHARLEDVLGPQGWEAAQRDYARLLELNDPTARAAEARVKAAEIADADLAQERLAYLVEEAAKRHPAPGVVGLIQRILGAFRRWAATSPVYQALERLGIPRPTLKPADFVAFAHVGLAQLGKIADARIRRDTLVRDLVAERKGAGLPDEPASYFQNTDTLVPVDKLDATKDDREHTKAPDYLRQAREGRIPKREPITVRQVGDRYQVLDGNATLAAAKQAGWKQLPVRMADWRDEIRAAKDLPAELATQLRTMYRAAERALPHFREEIRDLARELGLPQPMIAPLKGITRAIEKAQADYGGNAGKLKDLVRGTIVVEHAGQVGQVLDALRARFGDDFVLKRDSLTSDGPGSIDGYRDALGYVTVDGVTSEVQINTPEMLQAKEGPGHKLYEQARTIEAAALREGRALNAEEESALGDLRQQMQQVYDSAWTRAQSKRNSVSESSVAPKNDTGGNGLGSDPSQARYSAPPSGVGSRVTGTESSNSPNSVPAGKEAGNRIGGRSGVDGGTVPRARQSVVDPLTRSRTGTLPLPPTTPAGQPAAMAQSWREKILEAFNRRWEPLGDMPERDLYLDLRGLAAGRIAKSEDLAEAIVAKLGNIPKDARAAVYTYLTTAGADPAAIPDLGVRMAAQDVKHLIGRIGDSLVERGMIPAESREKYRDAYLPRLYFAHLLKGDAWRSFGTGKGLSDQGYRKARNDEIPEEVRKVVLGEVTDPAFLAAVAVAKPARDLALVDWLSQVAGEKAWTLPEATITWNGKKVTPHWLKDRAEQLRGQARLYEDAESAAHARMLADELDNLADQAFHAIGQVPDEVRKKFKQIPDTARYGPMRGLWTRKEIYEDVVGLARLVPEDRNFAERALGFGGWSTKAVGLWKWAKVAANPPSQIRNLVSNSIMLQLSGVPMHRIPDLLARSVGEIRNNGRAYQVAKEHGVTAGTFAAEELTRLHTELLDVAKREGQLGTMGQINLMARRFYNLVGDVYQGAETIFKTAKVMHELEKGSSPAVAAREAQKWLFDYSLVPQSVRYLRNAPIGAPFLTYAYKALPRLLEVGLMKPWRLAPYIGLYYGWQYALAAYLGEEPEDLDKLKEALPDWMQDRTGVLMMPFKDSDGRWIFVDTGYYLPWTMWWDTIRHGVSGDLNKAREDMGLISGPVVDVTVAMATGRDNFTNEEIANPADPLGRQWQDRAMWAWGLAAPPMLDLRHGALGRSLDAASGRVDRQGYPTSTATQAALRWVGVNVYPTDLEQSRDRNIRRLVMELQDTLARARVEVTKAAPEDREAVAAQYREEIQARQKKIHDYQESTTVPEGLR